MTGCGTKAMTVCAILLITNTIVIESITFVYHIAYEAFSESVCVLIRYVFLRKCPVYYDKRVSCGIIM
jgi:hypothetical protein